jgi:hypothetical protein
MGAQGAPGARNRPPLDSLGCGGVPALVLTRRLGPRRAHPAGPPPPPAPPPQTWLYLQPGGTVETQGASLRGQPKFSGWIVPGYNGSRLGVQGGNSTLAAFDGPTQSMEVRLGPGGGRAAGGGAPPWACRGPALSSQPGAAPPTPRDCAASLAPLARLLMDS